MTKEGIIIKGHELFFYTGYKETTIEKIATQLKISKKTFYKYFKTKEGFIIEVSKFRIGYFKKMAAECSEKSADAIDYFFNFLKASEKMSNFVSSTENMKDLYHYYRNSVPEYESNLTKMAKTFMRSVIERGQKEEIIDPEINIDVFLTLYADQYPHIRTSSHLLMQHSSKELLNLMYYSYLKAILNSKGIALLENKSYSLQIAP